ncbi:hypothetical protein [Sphingomonas sp. 10B4]|uniref:hypothetical protein n=1 Tax=Sphingomonas sp. 10B4 TaxID=3048575 RepID=UPI002AB4C7C2|nr:hypothetical protein [Sphingomonas sp. 10B4]MDY7523701.1 hypothetical protein [Sphingomonas sp. 10B4]MEB0284456.1 hypothetical protein [Sphingomonas sp. 10B4]
MDLEDAEFQYLQERVVRSLSMAGTATGCARMVHEDLAARYSARLETIFREHAEQTAVSIITEQPNSAAVPLFVDVIRSFALPPMMQQPR